MTGAESKYFYNAQERESETAAILGGIILSRTPRGGIGIARLGDSAPLATKNTKRWLIHL